MSKQVLIVEDDADIRDSMTELLGDEGYQVVAAVHGRDALEKLRAASEPPGLILLDLMMPEMDGYTFRAEQLKDSELAIIPVVLMSAGGELEAKAKQLSAQGVLKKPFRDLELIFSTVAKFFWPAHPPRVTWRSSLPRNTAPQDVDQVLRARQQCAHESAVLFRSCR